MDKHTLAQNLNDAYPSPKYKFKIVASKNTDEVIMWINTPHLYRALISDVTEYAKSNGWAIWQYRAIMYARYKTWGYHSHVRLMNLIRTKSIKDLQLIIKHTDENFNNQ